MAKANLARLVWSAILPINCLSCGEESDWLCDDCRGDLLAQRSELCFCGQAAENGLCDKHRQELGLDGLTTLWRYSDRGARELIHAIKYRGHTDAIGWLAATYRRKVLAGLPRGDWTVTAVPLARNRLRQRGFNQAELIGRQMTASLYDYESLLLRRRDTQPQVKLKRSERQKNMVRAFAINPRVTVPEQVILVDDVITTGSTLAACAQALRKAGVQRIWALTIAHG